MTSSGFEQYVKERYENQLKWYSTSATNNKKWYRGYQVGIAALSAVVTVTVALGMNDGAGAAALSAVVTVTVALGMNDGAGAAWHVVSLTTSALVTVLATLQKTFRFHDNWVEYRTTAEDLKKERYYHEFLCGDYATAESPDQLFVKRVEGLISQQNTQWNVGTITSRLQGGLDSKVKSVAGPRGD